jgi:hypothetical protein
VKPRVTDLRINMEVWCYMRVYENAIWDAAQQQSEWGIPSHSVFVWQSGNGRRWVKIWVKHSLGVFD